MSCVVDQIDQETVVLARKLLASTLPSCPSLFFYSLLDMKQEARKNMEPYISRRTRCWWRRIVTDRY